MGSEHIWLCRGSVSAAQRLANGAWYACDALLQPDIRKHAVPDKCRPERCHKQRERRGECAPVEANVLDVHCPRPSAPAAGGMFRESRQYPGAHAAGLPPRRAAPSCGVPGVQHLVHRGCAVPLQQWPAASAADRHHWQHSKMSPPAPAPGTTTRQQPTDLALRVTEHTQELQRQHSPVQRSAAPVHATIHCSHVV